MSGKYPPLSAAEMKRALKNLGFSFQGQTGSHEKWTHPSYKGRYRRVDVDCHHAPFHRELLSYMLKQGGFSREELYAALD